MNKPKTPKPDLAKLGQVCPEAANEVEIRRRVLIDSQKTILGSMDENTIKALENDLNRIEAIATCILALADENERMSEPFTDEILKGYRDSVNNKSLDNWKRTITIGEIRCFLATIAAKDKRIERMKGALGCVDKIASAMVFMLDPDERGSTIRSAYQEIATIARQVLTPDTSAGEKK